MVEKIVHTSKLFWLKCDRTHTKTARKNVLNVENWNYDGKSKFSGTRSNIRAKQSSRFFFLIIEIGINESERKEPSLFVQTKGKQLEILKILLLVTKLGMEFKNPLEPVTSFRKKARGGEVFKMPNKLTPECKYQRVGRSEDFNLKLLWHLD